MSRSSPFQYSLRSLLIVTALCAAAFLAFRCLGVEPFTALLGAGIVSLSLAVAVERTRDGVVRAAAADPMSPQRVAGFRSEIDAAILVNALEDEGISARTVGDCTSGFRAEAPGDVQVWVARRDLQKALEVLSQLGAMDRGEG